MSFNVDLTTFLKQQIPGHKGILCTEGIFTFYVYFLLCFICDTPCVAFAPSYILICDRYLLVCYSRLLVVNSVLLVVVYHLADLHIQRLTSKIHTIYA